MWEEGESPDEPSLLDTNGSAGEAVSKVTSFPLAKTGDGSGGVDRFSVFNPLYISPNLGGEALFRALYLSLDSLGSLARERRARFLRSLTALLWN